MLFNLTQGRKGFTAPMTANNFKLYGQIILICFMFREQLDVNSELHKEKHQFVSLLLTYINFNFNYFTMRLRTTKDTTIVPKVGTEILRRKKTINLLR